MKTFVWMIVLSMTGGLAYAQTGLLVTSTEVNNILKGNYNPAVYPSAMTGNNPNTVSARLLNSISTDSLKSSLLALTKFQNRNTGSDTVSATRGIGAARRWVYNTFLRYSAANANRLRVSYFQFTQSICSKTSHRNVIAVLPGTQTTDKSVLLVEAHLDSRCENVCDISCNAFGADDDASGTAMVLELARVLSQYSFRNTIVFSINIGEEQGLYGATAFANYCKSNAIKIKAVNNNDISGGIFCGHTSSAPSCPAFGNIDSIGLRIFSLGGFNSPHKQWARYIKLQYNEQLGSLVNVLTDIRIMTPEDRTGRGGDHQPFRADGFTAVRFTTANEDGNANITATYTDRQHSVRDSLGLDTNSDGLTDSFYVNLDYLARNALVNGNALAMAALSTDTAKLTAAVLSANRVKVSFSSATAHPAYRVAVRSATNDWDTLYTITGKKTDTITVPYGSNTNFFISAASIDNNNLESLFSTEYSLVCGTVPTSATEAAPVQTAAVLAPVAAFKGIQLLQNRPNPFDEATIITIVSDIDAGSDRAWVIITSVDGKVLQRMQVPLQKGVNEVTYHHGYGAKGICIYTLYIDGLPVQSKKMVFGRP